MPWPHDEKVPPYAHILPFRNLSVADLEAPAQLTNPAS